MAYGRIAFFQPTKCRFSLHLNGLWLMRANLPQFLPIRFPRRSSAVLRLRIPTRKRLSSCVHFSSILSSLNGVNELRNTEMPDRPIDAQDSPPSLMQAGLCGKSVTGKDSGRSVRANRKSGGARRQVGLPRPSFDSVQILMSQQGGRVISGSRWKRDVSATGQSGCDRNSGQFAK